MARVQIINPNSTQAPVSPAPVQAPAAGMDALYRMFGLNVPGGAPAPPSSSAPPQAFDGFLGSIIGALRGGTGNVTGNQPALRQRPEDIERLVSMSQHPRGSNAGGFFGGMFDDKG